MATKIAKLMTERGIKGTDLEKGAKLNKCHVSMVKNGKQNMTLLTIKKLCLFFKCTPNDILDYENWKKK